MKQLTARYSNLLNTFRQRRTTSRKLAQ